MTSLSSLSQVMDAASSPEVEGKVICLRREARAVVVIVQAETSADGLQLVKKALFWSIGASSESSVVFSALEELFSLLLCGYPD